LRTFVRRFLHFVALVLRRQVPLPTMQPIASPHLVRTRDESEATSCSIQGSTSINAEKEKTMNRYSFTTPRTAAGAAALAATVLVIGLSVIAPARMSSAPAYLQVQAAGSAPIVLDRIEVCAERDPAMVSVRATDAPADPRQQI
jgi:hypothetical protein